MVIVWVFFCGLRCSSQDEVGGIVSPEHSTEGLKKSPAVEGSVEKAVVWKIRTETPCPNPRGGGEVPAPATLLLVSM